MYRNQQQLEVPRWLTLRKSAPLTEQLSLHYALGAYGRVLKYVYGL